MKNLSEIIKTHQCNVHCGHTDIGGISSGYTYDLTKIHPYYCGQNKGYLRAFTLWYYNDELLDDSDKTFDIEINFNDYKQYVINHDFSKQRYWNLGKVLPMEIGMDGLTFRIVDNKTQKSQDFRLCTDYCILHPDVEFDNVVLNTWKTSENEPTYIYSDKKIKLV